MDSEIMGLNTDASTSTLWGPRMFFAVLNNQTILIFTDSSIIHQLSPLQIDKDVAFEIRLLIVVYVYNE